jgi:hypothetical protein
MGRFALSELEWAGKSVPQMWASAQAADTQTAWQQVNAWRQTRDLLLHHAGRLKACADELRYTWPPERSRAAQAFVLYIVELHAAIMAASTGAATNHLALAEVLTSLSAAKADMAKLKQDWDTYESASPIEKAETRSKLDSADPREALNAKARARMAQNDREVFDSSRRFVELTPTRERQVGPPEPWDPNGGVGSGSPSTSPTGGSPSTSRMTAPVVESVSAIDDQIDLAGARLAQKLPGLIDSLPSGITPGLSPTPGSAAPSTGVGAVGGVSVVRPSLVGRSRSPGAAGPIGPITGGPGRGPGKVNPVGGVVEANRQTAASSMLPFTGGARGNIEGDRPTPAALTTQWDVLQGVSPVIEPLPERPFVLGPGVIGIDR